MKVVKYLFALFSIVLILYAGYVITQKNAQKEELQQSETQEETIQELKPIRIGICGLDTMNPILTQNKEVLNACKLIFEPLLSIKEDASIEYGLAKEFSKTSDVTYIIKLQENRKWQDGTMVVGKDVQFTIDRLKENTSLYSANVQEVSSVEVLDNATVKITLAQPVPFFEYRLEFPILCSHYYENENFYESAKLPMGTGMYKIEKQEGNSITLQKNIYHPNYEKLSTQEVKLFRYDSMGEVFNSFKMGNIDVFTTETTNLQDYIGTMGYSTKEMKGRNYDFLSFNCTDTLLGRKEVREAISYAIDRGGLVNSIFNNAMAVASFPLDYGNYLYPGQETSAGYNPEQAKKVLEDAGWTYQYNRWQKKENYTTVRLQVTITVDETNQGRTMAAEYIKTQLEEIGIKTTIQKVSNTRYTQLLQDRKYQIIITGIQNGLSPDVSYFFGEGNVANYQNETALELIQDAKRTIMDEEALKGIYQKIIEVYNKEIPFLGLYRNKQILVTNQTVSGEMEPTFYTSYYHFETWKNS